MNEDRLDTDLLDEAIRQAVTTRIALGPDTQLDAHEDVLRDLARSTTSDSLHLDLAMRLAVCTDIAACRLEGTDEPSQFGAESTWLLAVAWAAIDNIRNAIPAAVRGEFLTAALDAIDHLAGTPSDLPHWRPDMRDVLCLPLSHEMTDDHDRVAPAPFALANTPSAVYELVLVADLARTNGPLATIVDAPLAGDALAKIADVGSQHAIGRLVADLAELLAELADGEEQLEALDDVLAHR